MRMAFDDDLKAIENLDWPLRKKVGAFISGTAAAAQFAEEMMVPVLHGQIGLSPREQAITGTYYRMYSWMKTLATLNDTVHYQAVASAARTLFELLLDLKLLTEDASGEQIKRFLAFPEIEKFRVAKRMTEFREANPPLADVDPTPMRNFLDEPGRAKKIDLLRSEYYGTDKEGKPIRPPHWSGKNVEQRARKAGKQYESWYVELYSWLSWHLHSGSVGYEGLSEDGMHALFGLVHRHAQIFFLEGTVHCAKAMKITKAIDGFFDFIERLERLPGEITVKEQLEFVRQQARSALKK
jgi:hypothetical protein